MFNIVLIVMKAVIFAAGKGTRLENLTKDCPKPMIKIHGRPILEYVLFSLPSEIEEIIIVVGYLKDKIENHFGKKFGKIPINYVEQKEFTGTAAALWSVKDFLNEEKFIALNGDDLSLKNELKQFLSCPLAIGVHQNKPPDERFFALDIDQNGLICGFHRPTKMEQNKGVPLATGVYVLDKRIFRYQPVKIKTGEYGLPQTIFEMAKDYPIKAIFMKNWQPINCPEDIERAEEFITKNYAESLD